jgi:hypothetical protein
LPKLQIYFVHAFHKVGENQAIKLWLLKYKRDLSALVLIGVLRPAGRI